jgi:hypothetical protein
MCTTTRNYAPVSFHPASLPHFCNLKPHQWEARCHVQPSTSAGTYGYSLAYGGPVTIIWGWITVSLMNIILALVLAEICSSFPTSGGVYFFSHRLAGAPKQLAAAVLHCNGNLQPQ